MLHYRNTLTPLPPFISIYLSSSLRFYHCASLLHWAVYRQCCAPRSVLMALVVGFPSSLDACYNNTHNPPFQHPTFLDTIHAVVYWIRSRFGERTCRFLMDMNGILLKLEGTGWVVLQYMLVQGTPSGSPPPSFPPQSISLSLSWPDTPLYQLC